MSQIIQFLRFPLIVGVVLVHCVPVGLWGTPLTLVLGQTCVPTFFVISGYLFFSRLERWDWSVFTMKLRTRVKTLFIPFLIWNLLLALFICRAIILHAQFSQLWHFLTERGLFSIFLDYWRMPSSPHWLHEVIPSSLFPVCESFADTFVWYQPLNVPLWYQRDLILLCLAAPLFHFLLRSRATVTLSLLFALLILSGGWFPLRSITFFAIGASLRLRGIRPVLHLSSSSHQALSYLFTVSFIILFLLCCITHGATTPWGSLFLPLFLLMAPFMWFTLADALLRHGIAHEKPALTASCYLIYVLHFRPLLAYTDTLAHWLLSPISSLPVVSLSLGSMHMSLSAYTDLCYLISPAMTIATCVLIHALASRLMPRTLAILTGGRA